MTKVTCCLLQKIFTAAELVTGWQVKGYKLMHICCIQSKVTCLQSVADLSEIVTFVCCECIPSLTPFSAICLSTALLSTFSGFASIAQARFTYITRQHCCVLRSHEILLNCRKLGLWHGQRPNNETACTDAKHTKMTPYTFKAMDWSHIHMQMINMAPHAVSSLILSTQNTRARY